MKNSQLILCVKKFFAFILFFLTCFPVINMYSQTYNLVWSDEFDYSGLPDEAKWNYDVGGGGWGNQELQYYTSKRLQNAKVEDGKLIITAIKEIYSGKDYTSARLVTKYKGDWLYGKMEINAKLPAGRGTWPAIWMLPTDWEYGDWPSSGEIDIMEHVGYDEGVVHATVHTEAYNHTLGTQKGDTIHLDDATSAFHVYSMEWTPIKIDFFADGVKYFTFYQYSTEYTKWPFNKRFHLLLNIAVGGSWGGAQGVDVYAFPTQMEIDYVRVYQLSTATGTESSELEMKKLQDSEAEFEIFPNPFNDHLNISYSEDIDQIDIYNCYGNKSMDFKNPLADNSLTDKSLLVLNLDNLKPGIYFLALKYQNELVGLKSAIKY